MDKSLGAKSTGMGKTIRFRGIRRYVSDPGRVAKFYSNILQGEGDARTDGGYVFIRPGWELEIKKGSREKSYTGWITFAVPSLDRFMESMDAFGIKHEELIPPWLEKGAKITRFFEVEGLMLQAEESPGITAGRDDIVLGVRDIRHSLRTYCNLLEGDVYRDHSIFVEIPIGENAPVVCLLKVEKVLSPCGVLILETDSMEKGVRHAEQSGFRILGKPKKIPGEGFRVAGADQDGNHFELFAKEE